jgi:hypothetical protein
MRTHLLILSILFCVGANAQIIKGSTLFGGSVNFSHADNANGTAFYASVQYAKAYKDNNFFGLQVGYGHNHHINQNWNFYNGGIFYRKYLPIVKSLYLFGEGNFNLGYSRLYSISSNPQSETIDNNYNATISLMPGLSYAVNSKLQLEIAFPNIASLYYGHHVYKNTTSGVSFTTHDSNYGLNSSSQLNTFSNIQFGFRFLFQKRKAK